jgi:hypothetical protein
MLINELDIFAVLQAVCRKRTFTDSRDVCSDTRNWCEECSAAMCPYLNKLKNDNNRVEKED